MSISSLSFYNQNRNWQIEQQRWSDQLNATSAVGSVLSSALTNQATGLAAISNHQALVRVTKELKAAATSALGASTLSKLTAASKASTGSKSSASSTRSSLNRLA